MPDRKHKTLLDELDEIYQEKNRSRIVETRACHIIDSAINLIQKLYETYDYDVANDLERRLINSIKGRDNKKFVRGVRKTENK